MNHDARDDWELAIFVPEGEQGGEVPPDDAVREDSLPDVLGALKRVTRVRAADVKKQWERTVDTLINLSTTVANGSKDWNIDEIEVGLTLSAKGELLFIAEAGAQASIKIKLKRRPAEVSPCETPKEQHPPRPGRT